MSAFCAIVLGYACCPFASVITVVCLRAAQQRAKEHCSHPALPPAALDNYTTSIVCCLLRDRADDFHFSLPDAALDSFESSCVCKMMKRWESQEWVSSLPVSSLELFAQSAMQRLLHSKDDDLVSLAASPFASTGCLATAKVMLDMLVQSFLLVCSNHF